MRDDDEPFGKNDHDRHQPGHSGKHGHECPEWDYLYICADCEEFEFCECYKVATTDPKPIDQQRRGDKGDA